MFAHKAKHPVSFLAVSMQVFPLTVAALHEQEEKDQRNLKLYEAQTKLRSLLLCESIFSNIKLLQIYNNLGLQTALVPK